MKGVGPLRGDLLRKELGIFTFNDLLQHFPIRHVDKKSIGRIADINFQTQYIQVAGVVRSVEILGEKRQKRLIAWLDDGSGMLEMVWFQGINWMQRILKEGEKYLVYGKAGFFNNTPQFSHPEIELMADDNIQGKNFLEPVYPTTEKLRAKSLNGRQIGKLTSALLPQLSEKDIPENMPSPILQKLQLPSRYEAYCNIHFPSTQSAFELAVRRLKFEEFFIAQLRLQLVRLKRHKESKGLVFDTVGDYFNNFYHQHLPFELTGAQKRVIKEIRNDTARGYQMNRLLQGDVGSGKTIVALLAMLIALDNGFQACLMAPTEVLAQQHFNGLRELVKELPLKIALLTGSTRAKQRREIAEGLSDGSIHILTGTHAIIEETVQFKNLGLAIVDEQHRFGVAQRAKLWEKSAIPPHILVMTATPIPRTLAMTAYGDLDYSVIDELPPGRQTVTTVHRNEMKRAAVMDFIKTEIQKGRQAYIIYPLIEESEKQNYEDLMQGYEQVKSYFPEHRYSISVLHGKMPTDQKDVNMQRFVNGETQIMVSTTVIEVGVNVPNASVMLIESAEKFGLSQLHQLRGRVGRGTEKSYCILLTGSKLSQDARSRLKIMCETNNGFIIAEKDMELRGPGDVEGTRQSGAMNFKIADIVNDKELLEQAKTAAEELIEKDEDLQLPENISIKTFLLSKKGKTVWSKIS